MTTIDHLARDLQARQQAAQRRRDAAQDGIRSVVQAAERQGRQRLTPAEDRHVDRMLGDRDTAISELDEIKANLAQVDAARASDYEYAQRSNEHHPTGAVITGRADARFRVTSERRTYAPDTDPKEIGFLLDVARHGIRGDITSQQRLGQHMHEEEVDRPQYMQRANAGTGNFAGLVVPQYLTDMYAPLARPMQPFVDICNHHDLPAEGMTVNIPLLTTGQAVALQTSENSPGTSTAPNDTLLTENVQTSTGNSTISRQAIDRGTGIDEVVMQDLFRALASNIDNTLITQATTGLAALAQNSVGTLSTLTASGVYSKILGAMSGVEGALLGLALPTHVLMYPYRWYWLASQLGSTWPLVNVGGPQYPWSVGNAVPGAGYDTDQPVGFLPAGIRVIMDANISITSGVSANQDSIFVVPADECHYWSDPNAPVFIRAEQPAAASLGVLMVIYSYYAYSFRRYTNAMQSIIGTALVAPSF